MKEEGGGEGKAQGQEEGEKKGGEAEVEEAVAGGTWGIKDPNHKVK